MEESLGLLTGHIGKRGPGENEHLIFAPVLAPRTLMSNVPSQLKIKVANKPGNGSPQPIRSKLKKFLDCSILYTINLNHFVPAAFNSYAFGPVTYVRFRNGS